LLSAIVPLGKEHAMHGIRRLGALLLSSLTALAVAAPAAVATGSALPVSQSQGTGRIVVQTPDGALRGIHAHDVDSFLGIRYAQPPTGRLRWVPPKPVQPWKGVRSAEAYGNRCPAPASGNGPQSLTEDCLFLNVQRPATARADGRLPVYVWIHGGGLATGSSNQHDGTKFVRESGIIVVTINYRLGVLGFLAHPALTAAQGESGNYGFMDQQQALRWVRRSIAAFGGDPHRVTIGGESAGGWSVCGHLSAPGSRGLFAGAVIESGSCLSWPQADADSFADQVTSPVGCPATADPAAIACLRRVSVQALLDAANNWFGPMLVNTTPTLPQDPFLAVITGAFTRVPVLIGANRDEGRSFTQGDVGWTQQQYEQWVRDNFGPDADAVLAHYPWPATSDRWTGAYLEAAILTDSGFLAGIGGCGGRFLTNTIAGYVPTFSYQFDHRTGPGLTPIPGYVWGAGHAAELAYMWPSFDNGIPIAPTFNAAERRLAHDMVAWWGHFVRTGAPGSVGGTAWPRLVASAGPSARLLSLRAGGQSTPITDARLSAQHQCGFWDALFGPEQAARADASLRIKALSVRL
jgi:carboxylesterase type B